MNPAIFRPSAALALFGALCTSAGDGRAAAVDPSGDLDHVRPLLDQTLETEKSGIEIRWANPATGYSGKIRVERTFFRDDRPCRDYLRTVSRPGQSGFVIRGTACRTGRAVWTIGDEVAVETDQPGERQPAAAASARPAAPETASPAETSPAAQPGDRLAEPSSPEAEGPAARRATAGRPDAEAGRAEDPFVSFTLPSRSPI